jgi:hypothetical protein
MPLPQGDLFTAGDVVNPGIGAVLADTGVMTQEPGLGAYMSFNVWASSTVAANFRFSVRNASDVEVTAKSFNWRVAANSTQGPPGFGLMSFIVPQSFRVKILAPAAITGTVSAVIQTGLDQVIQ